MNNEKVGDLFVGIHQKKSPGPKSPAIFFKQYSTQSNYFTISLVEYVLSFSSL